MKAAGPPNWTARKSRMSGPSQPAGETRHRVRDLAGPLAHHEVEQRAELLALAVVDCGSLDPNLRRSGEFSSVAICDDLPYALALPCRNSDAHRASPATVSRGRLPITATIIVL